MPGNGMAFGLCCSITGDTQRSAICSWPLVPAKPGERRSAREQKGPVLSDACGRGWVSLWPHLCPQKLLCSLGGGWLGAARTALCLKWPCKPQRSGGTEERGKRSARAAHGCLQNAARRPHQQHSPAGSKAVVAAWQPPCISCPVSCLVPCGAAGLDHVPALNGPSPGHGQVGTPCLLPCSAYLLVCLFSFTNSEMTKACLGL